MVESVSMDKVDSINNHIINTLTNLSSTALDSDRTKPVHKALLTEDCKNFNHYLEHLGLSSETNIVVLSSLHHYYYDAEEMTEVKTVINLRELNLIKELKDFLHSSFYILPPDCKFIGCFVNNKKQDGFLLSTNPRDNYYKRNSDAIEKGIVSSSPFLNMIYNVIDSKTNKYLSERSVSQILVEHGFKIVDFTEIDGLHIFVQKALGLQKNKKESIIVHDFLSFNQNK